MRLWYRGELAPSPVRRDDGGGVVVDPVGNQLIELLPRPGRVGLRAEVVAGTSQEATSPNYQSSCIIIIDETLEICRLQSG